MQRFFDYNFVDYNGKIGQVRGATVNGSKVNYQVWFPSKVGSYKSVSIAEHKLKPTDEVLEGPLWEES